MNRGRRGLTGEITIAPGSQTQLLYVEATGNPTMQFVIDDVRVVEPTPPPVPEWVTASGTVTAPTTTLPTDEPFVPVGGPGALEVEVEVDGYAVPATWDYEPSPSPEGCTVVLTGTEQEAPGTTCEAVILTLSGAFGEPGSRVRQVVMTFEATEVLTGGPHEILFTTDLSEADFVPDDWTWETSGIIAGGFGAVAGYSCDELPLFTARAPAWAVSSGAYFELIEQYAANDPVCG